MSRQDKTLKGIIGAYDGEMLVSRGDAFYTLARSIAGQQISVKAADTVWKRIEEAVPITPTSMAIADEQTLRAAGLSRQKVMYMQALAGHFIHNKKVIASWDSMGDDDIIRELSSIKGIGRWTAEMFLIFHMGRPDVFPLADIGLQKAIFRHYNEGQPLTRKEMAALGERWKPYRTAATWYLWRALDPVPVAY
ncbi:MAG: DNA-3-methyladenine glycosylase [Alphaproteobacteria bacterium]